MGQDAAIKEIKIQEEDKRMLGVNFQSQISEIDNEVALMAKLRSPFIVTFFGTVVLSLF